MDAAEAFALGWAWSTAKHPQPLTERAMRRLDAAAAVWEDSAPARQATLQLGQLEGVWAVVYARREALDQLHGQALSDTLDAIGALNWDQVLDQVRQQLLLDPSVTGRQLMRGFAASVENLIATQLPAADLDAWHAAMTAALVDATAEGQTAALAIMGDAANIVIDWDLAASEAKAALAGGQMFDADAASWLAKQTHGLGYQIGQTLARLWDERADAETMAKAIQDLLGAPHNTARVILDQAVGRALSAGSAATYAAADVTYTEFVTAGDGRVCPVCAQAEDQGPYLQGDLPDCPQHPSCRCCYAPSDYQPTGSVLQLLTRYEDPDTADAEAA